jgi:hypothetical protein
MIVHFCTDGPREIICFNAKHIWFVRRLNGENLPPEIYKTYTNNKFITYFSYDKNKITCPNCLDNLMIKDIIE